MFRFILKHLVFLTLFISNSLIADVSVEPPYFYAKRSASDSYYADTTDIDNPIEFSGLADACSYYSAIFEADTSSAVHYFSSYDVLPDHCHFIWRYQDGDFISYTREYSYVYPQWQECPWVEFPSLTCRSDYPADFETYDCINEFNTPYSNTLTVCTVPPPCFGETACYQFASDLKGCDSKKASAALDPYLDYTESWSYQDDYTWSLDCGLKDSDRLFDPTPTDPDTPFTPTADPTSPTGSGTDPTGGGGVTDPTGGGGEFSGGDGSGSTPTPESTIDDTRIINAIDSQTSMLNTQLNNIDTSINEIDDEGIINAIDSQTSMLNTQLNNLGNAISDADNDSAIIGAINNQIQTTEDVIDAINGLDIGLGNTDVLTDSSGTNGDINSIKIDSFTTKINNSAAVTALNSISNSIVLDTPACTPLSIDLTGTLLNSVVSTNIHCTVIASTAPIISPVMLAVWSILGFRIFASA